MRIPKAERQLSWGSVPKAKFRCRPLADVPTHTHTSQMRSLILCLMATLVAGCGSNRTEAQVSKVEVRASGVSVTVDASGNGKPVVNVGEEGRSPSSFNIDRIAYDRLLDQIAVFRPASGPTAETSRRFFSENCPPDTPQVTDAGMISIRWIGPGLDHLYVADFGCDPRKNAARNRALRAVVNASPMPLAQTVP